MNDTLKVRGKKELIEITTLKNYDEKILILSNGQ